MQATGSLRMGQPAAVAATACRETVVVTPAKVLHAQTMWKTKAKHISVRLRVVACIREDTSRTSCADCGGPNCSGCSGEKFCLSGRDCQSQVCIGTGNSRRCAGFSDTDNLANGGEADVDCGSRVSNKCAEGFQCQTSDDCLLHYTCVEYLFPVEGRFCAIIGSLRRPKPEYLSSINLGLQFRGMGKHNFEPDSFRKAIGALVGMPQEAVRLVALTDEIGPYPGDPEALRERRALAEYRSSAFDYVSGMNVSMVVFTERWELRLILERLSNLLHMRVVEGKACYAGSSATATAQGTPICSNTTQLDDLEVLDRGVHMNENGSNLLQLLNAEGMPATSVRFLALQQATISTTDQGPDIFYRPERLEFARKLDYSSNTDGAGFPFWWAGELFPQAPVVILRDRHGRHIQDVTPDTQITASLNEAEFPPTRNPVTQEILQMNPTRIAGPSTKLYLQGEASFDRIYITSSMNRSRLFFALEINAYASTVPVLTSEPLVVRVRPKVTVVIPPPEVTHPALILFATGVLLGAAGFVLIRMCKARMWCRVPEREKRAGRTQVKPSTAPKLDTAKYEGHDAEKEQADAAEQAEAAAQAAAYVETKQTPFKNIALDMNNYSEFAARLPRPPQTKAVGEGMFYGGEAKQKQPSDGKLVSSGAVTSAEHVFSHKSTFASIAAIQKARQKIEGSTNTDESQLSGRMPQGDTARSHSEHEGELHSTYNALGVVPPPKKKKAGIMSRVFRGSSSKADAEGTYDLSQAVQVRSGQQQESAHRVVPQGSSRRNAFARQSSSASMMSAGGLSVEDYTEELEQIARGPLYKERDSGTGVFSLNAQEDVPPAASGTTAPPRPAMMRSASSRSVRGIHLPPTVSEG